MEIINTDNSIPFIEISESSVLCIAPIVSVVMITYNHESYIASAIEGVLRQETDFEMELIVAEDCSTDQTRKIILEYQKQYPHTIRLLFSETNIGMQKNLIRAEKASRGKYIAYCEGDDYWHNPEKIDKQVRYFENNRNCGLICSDMDKMIPKTGVYISQVNSKRGIFSQDVSHPFNSILKGDLQIFTCTVCVRKRLVHDAIAKEWHLLTSSESKTLDLPRWLYIATKADIHYMNESFATYRKLEESASHSRYRHETMKFLLSQKAIRKYFAYNYKCPSETRLHVDIKYYSYLLKVAFHRNDKLAARDAYHGLRNCQYDMSIIDIAYYLGAVFGFVKFVAIPFRITRRVVKYGKLKTLS